MAHRAHASLPPAVDPHPVVISSGQVATPPRINTAANCPPQATLSADIAPSGGFATASQVEATFDNARGKEGCSAQLVLPSTYDTMTAQQQMLALFNAERTDRGLGTLTLDPNLLSEISYHHSLEMGTYKYFDHPSAINQPGAGNIWNRFTDNPAINGHWAYLGENIAAGYSTAAAAVYAYMYQDSGSGWGHRQNILGYISKSFGHFTHVGIGVATVAGSPYSIYYTDDFLQSAGGNPYQIPASPDTQAPTLQAPTYTGTAGGTVNARVAGVQDTGSCCGEAGLTGVVFYANGITMTSGNSNAVPATQGSSGVWTASLSLPAGGTLHAVAVDGSGNFTDCPAGAGSCGTPPTPTPTPTSTSTPTDTPTPAPTTRPGSSRATPTPVLVGSGLTPTPVPLRASRLTPTPSGQSGPTPISTGGRSGRELPL